MVMDGPSDTTNRINELKDLIHKEHGLGTADEYGNITLPPLLDELFGITFRANWQLETLKNAVSQVQTVLLQPPLYKTPVESVPSMTPAL